MSWRRFSQLALRSIGGAGSRNTPPFISIPRSGWNFAEILNSNANFACFSSEAVAAEPEAVPPNTLAGILSFSDEEFNELWASRRKRSKVRRATVDPEANTKLVPVLELLETGLGLDLASRKRMIKKEPSILSVPPATLKERLDWYINDVGFETAVFAKIVCANPYLINRPVEKLIAPKMAFFLEYGFSKEQFRVMLKKCPQMMSASLENKIEANVKRLKELGMSKEQVMEAALSSPHIVFRNFEQVIQPKIDWFKNTAGIDEETVIHKFLAKEPFAFTRSVSAMDSNYQWLTDKGYTSEQCREFITTNPTLIVGDPEVKEQRLEFLKEYLGLEADEVLRWNGCFGMRFDTPICVRMGFLDDKGVEVKGKSKEALFDCSDDDFVSENGLSGEEFGEFVKWWRTVEREEMISIIKEKKYMQ